VLAELVDADEGIAELVDADEGIAAVAEICRGDLTLDVVPRLLLAQPALR
jgi:hypothetical protein